MITKVEIKNFKSIREQTLEDLPPIVGIWGKNGTGKSSLLQAIVWAAKNAGNFEANGLNLDGLNVVFGRGGKYECNVSVTETKGDWKGVHKCVISDKGIHQRTSDILKEIRYFPPWRHISTRQHQVSDMIISDIGYRANTIHSFLHWFLHDLMGKKERGDEDAKDTLKRLNHWAQKIGYGQLLDTQVGSSVTGTYKDSTLHFEIPLVDGGFGGNSFLPILLECYKFKDGIIIIEEPEISLHPGAQGDIWEFMMEMAEKRNHQIIFTSHSPYLVRKIARTLSEGKLKDEIHVYYTSKTEKKGTEFELIPSEEIIKRFSEYWGDDIFPELRER